MKTLIIAIAAFAMTGLTTAAFCAPAATVPSAKVFYGDLNLQTPAGMKTLNRRIHSAARAVCDTSNVGVDGISRYQHCLRIAVGGAIKQVPSAESQQLASR